MIKKLVLLCSVFYLTGCNISKPIILNALNKKQVNYAYSQTSVRNGASNFVVARKTQTNVRDPENNDRQLECIFQIYISPLNNPASFDYRVNNYNNGQTPQDGQYKNIDASLFFQTKVTAKLYYVNRLTNVRLETYEKSITMQTVGNEQLKNIKVFKMYKLPYSTYDWPQVDNTYVFSYVYNNTLTAEYNDLTDIMTITPTNYEYDRFFNIVSHNEIFARFDANVNIADQLPDIPGEDNSNKLQQFYYYDFATLGALSISWRNELESYANLSRFKDAVRQQTSLFLNLNTDGKITYQYNASLTEELSAFNDGYSLGIEEGQQGTGTTRIQQVFRAIQSFLNIDFGFFKLAHVLGGMLVIAIVIFIVRRFR